MFEGGVGALLGGGECENEEGREEGEGGGWGDMHVGWAAGEGRGGVLNEEQKACEFFNKP